MKKTGFVVILTLLIGGCASNNAAITDGGSQIMPTTYFLSEMTGSFLIL